MHDGQDLRRKPYVLLRIKTDSLGSHSSDSYRPIRRVAPAPDQCEWHAGPATGWPIRR
jgi:hypothetical protein